MNIDKLRFSGDDSDNFKHLLSSINASHTEYKKQRRVELLSTSLKITKDITPELFIIVSDIESKLKLNHIQIEYYVYNNSEINASCFSFDDNIELVVMLSSGLVNIMKENELAFVIGHEIGHYLFNHLDFIDIEENYNLLKYHQYTEISADRIGLICSEHIENSIRAIIKTISGLNDNLISKNLHTFLHQHNALDGQNISNSTHPTLPTRAKALTLFSMSEPYYKWINETKKAPIQADKLDISIEKYLMDTSLKLIKEESEQYFSKLKMWTIVKIFLDSNSFSSDEYNILKQEIGNEKAKKIIKYTNSHGREKINEKVNELLIEYRQFSTNDKNIFIDNITAIFSHYNKYKIQNTLNYIDS